MNPGGLFLLVALCAVVMALIVREIDERLQFLLGSATVGLLFFTFLATRRGADAAVKTARASLQTARAHLFVDITPDGLFLENHGQTPAIEVNVKVQFSRRRVDRPVVHGCDVRFKCKPDDVIELCGVFSVIPPGKGRLIDIAPEPGHFTEELESEEGSVNLYWITTIYRDIFGESHWTVCEVTLRSNIEGGLPSTAELLDLK